MKKYISLCIALTFTLLTACENELPFNIKDNPPKLTINALINADSTHNVAYVNFTGKSKLGSAKETVLTVYINGVLAETLHPISETNSTSPISRFIVTSSFHPGDVIRIDAINSSSNSHAWAEVNVPQRPYIERVDTCKVKLKNYESFRTYMQYRIRIKDRENEANFYRLVLEKRSIRITKNNDHSIDTVIMNKSYNMIIREDVVLTDGHPQSNDDEENGFFDKAQNIYAVFDDSRFQDREYTLTVYADSSSGYYDDKYGWRYSDTNMAIRLLSISKEEYHYLKALNNIDSDIYNEGISEPIKIPSNVQGGTGIVGVSIESNVLLHIPN